MVNLGSSSSTKLLQNFWGETARGEHFFLPEIRDLCEWMKLSEIDFNTRIKIWPVYTPVIKYLWISF